MIVADVLGPWHDVEATDGEGRAYRDRQRLPQFIHDAGITTWRDVTAQAAELNELVGTQGRLLNTIREMSTPVVPLQEGVIVMPLVGMIDAERARQVMAALLAGVEAQRARVILVDITGVPVVDEEVAHSLIQAMRSAQLLGAEPILVGLRPEVAQTIVALGVNLEGLTTCGDLQQGLERATRRVR